MFPTTISFYTSDKAWWLLKRCLLGNSLKSYKVGDRGNQQKKTVEQPAVRPTRSCDPTSERGVIAAESVHYSEVDTSSLSLIVFLNLYYTSKPLAVELD
ncbi:hypothetical protein WJX82_009941 [Trebouxia sp. C0006]